MQKKNKLTTTHLGHHIFMINIKYSTDSTNKSFRNYLTLLKYLQNKTCIIFRLSVVKDYIKDFRFEFFFVSSHDYTITWSVSYVSLMLERLELKVSKVDMPWNTFSLSNAFGRTGSHCGLGVSIRLTQMETEIPENIVPVIPLRGCFLQTDSKLINYFILQNILKLAKTVIKWSKTFIRSWRTSPWCWSWWFWWRRALWRGRRGSWTWRGGRTWWWWSGHRVAVWFWQQCPARAPPDPALTPPAPTPRIEIATS